MNEFIDRVGSSARQIPGLMAALQSVPEGSNLFDGAFTHRSVINAGGVVSANNEFWLTGPIPVEADEIYTYTTPSGARNIAFYNDADAPVGGVTATGQVKAPAGATYMRQAHRYTDLLPSDLIVLKGRRQAVARTAVGNGPARTDARGLLRAAQLPTIPTRNLFNLRTHAPSRAVSGTDGALTVSADFWSTDFIRVRPLASYAFTAPAVQKNWAFYTADKQFVSARMATGSLDIPAGVEFVRGCNRYNDITPENFTIVEGSVVPVGPQPWVGEMMEAQANKGQPNGYPELDQQGKIPASQIPASSGSPLSGKLIAGLGDSITYGFIPRNAAGYPGQLSSWLVQAAATLGATTANHGMNGSTVAYHATQNPMSRRFNAIPNAADVIVLMGGTNDVRNGIALGAMGDTTDATFYGALDVVAQGLLQKFRYGQGTAVGAGKKIVFSTPIRLLDAGQPDGLHAVLPSFCDAIKAVAQRYAIPVFDAYNLSGLTPELFRTLRGTEAGYTDLYNPYVTDGTHPTTEGHRMLADAMAGFLRRLF